MTLELATWPLTSLTYGGTPIASLTQVCFKIGFIESNTQIYCSSHELKKILGETVRQAQYFSNSWQDKCCPGSDLPRRAWVKLNRLCTGVGHFNADMWRWGLSKSPACGCGADRGTAGRFITGCPLCRPPGGLCGLIVVDADAAARECFSASSQRDLSISFDFFGFTHKKKKKKVQIGQFSVFF